MQRSLLRRLIMSHTKTTRKHLTPELKLHLITPECPLWHASVNDSPFQDPFWAFYWPGGQAITRYILDHPKLFENKAVLDVGCGCGSASLASSLVGAKHVIANDIDQVALTAVLMNGELNSAQRNIQPCHKNWLSLPMDECQFDVILFGDMFYDPDFAHLIDNWLKSVNYERTTVLIGDPGRLAFTSHSVKKSLIQLASYDLSKTYHMENNGFTQGLVWRWNKD